MSKIEILLIFDNDNQNKKDDFEDTNESIRDWNSNSSFNDTTFLL